MKSRAFSSLAAGVCLLALGCSGPTTPSAETYFADARNNLAAQDYEAALKNLDRLIKAAGDDPLGRQGTIVRTALLSAMAEGTKLMAEAYREGAAQPAAEPRQGQFGRMKTDYYGISRVRLMDAMESVMGQRAKLGAESLPVEISFPDYSGADPAALVKVRNGQWADDGDRYRAELEMVRNALARTMARIVGAGEDIAKGKAAFEKGGIQVDPRIYLYELSNLFYRLSEIFERRALDDSRYRRISLEVVRDNLDVVLELLEAKPDKELEARVKSLKADCEKALKTLT